MRESANREGVTKEAEPKLHTLQQQQQQLQEERRAGPAAEAPLLQLLLLGRVVSRASQPRGLSQRAERHRFQLLVVVVQLGGAEGV